MDWLNKYQGVLLICISLLTMSLDSKGQDYVRVKDSMATGKFDSIIFIKSYGLGFSAYMGKNPLSRSDLMQQLKKYPMSQSELNKYDGYLKAQRISELLCVGFGVAALASYDPHHPKSFPGLAAAISGGCLGSMIIMHIQSRRHLRLSVEFYNKAIHK